MQPLRTLTLATQAHKAAALAVPLSPFLASHFVASVLVTTMAAPSLLPKITCASCVASMACCARLTLSSDTASRWDSSLLLGTMPTCV